MVHQGSLKESLLSYIRVRSQHHPVEGNGFSKVQSHVQNLDGVALSALRRPYPVADVAAVGGQKFIEGVMNIHYADHPVVGPPKSSFNVL